MRFIRSNLGLVVVKLSFFGSFSFIMGRRNGIFARKIMSYALYEQQKKTGMAKNSVT